MNLYPENLKEKIGFHKIQDLVADRCISEMGKDFVVKLQPLTELTRIEKLGYQTAEFKAILDSGELFPASNYIDVRAQLKKAKVEGSFLDQEEFYELKISLATIVKCLKFLSVRGAEYPLLAEASGMVALDPALLFSIEAIIDDRGQVRDNASRELQSLRKELVDNQSKARRTLDVMLRKAQKDGLCPDDVSLTIRNGRLVIPVMAEHKRRIRGFIHDESSTGNTVFLEPTEVLEINNEVRDLEYRERREIVRILSVLTDEIRGSVPELEKSYRFLGMIDFIRAKAKLAQDLDAVWPGGVKYPTINWNKAIHPLLFLSHKKQDKGVVPLNIALDKENRILLISGPNAGGKSVCLKTVALIQMMYQSGLMVPVGEESSFGIFHNFFIDIGDEQSIENDLSTYSSHLTNMRHFLENANGKTLALIDEFGTGTEPQFGGAIAETILKQLNHKQSFGVITTHYANLKKLAEKSKGIINGAMRFDPDRLEPLYELEMGKPGSSFALEIAGKIGLPQQMLNEAKKLVGHSHVKFDQLINELEAEKTRLQRELSQYQSKNVELDTNAKDYKDLKTYLDNEKAEILRKAKAEAKEIVSQANRKVEATIREIKERQADKAATKAVREELKVFEKQLEPEKPKKPRKPLVIVTGGEIAVGDKVKISGQETIGQVEAIKGKTAEVSIGELKSKIKLDRLERVTTKEFKEKKKKVSSMTGISFNDKAASFSSNIDLRGKRAEEALGEVDQFVDQAILLGQKELRIVHGKGYGILRDLIRNHFKGNRMISSVADEHIERGGSGVTVVNLK